MLQAEKHWPHGPSSAFEWVNCPARGKVDIPEQDTEHTRRGHKLHAQTAALIKYGLPVFGYTKDVRHVEAAAAAVREHVQGELHIEVMIESLSIFDHGGTIDVIGVTPDTLHVWDHKFGKWAVSVVDNYQIGCYLNLARQEFPGRTKFVGTIFQPKCSWKPQTYEFSEKWLDELEDRAAEASVENYLSAGKWCRWCPLRAGCAELRKHPELAEKFVA